MESCPHIRFWSRVDRYTLTETCTASRPSRKFDPTLTLDSVHLEQHHLHIWSFIRLVQNAYSKTRVTKSPRSRFEPLDCTKVWLTLVIPPQTLSPKPQISVTRALRNRDLHFPTCCSIQLGRDSWVVCRFQSRTARFSDEIVASHTSTRALSLTFGPRQLGQHFERGLKTIEEIPLTVLTYHYCISATFLFHKLLPKELVAKGWFGGSGIRRLPPMSDQAVL